MLRNQCQHDQSEQHRAGNKLCLHQGATGRFRSFSYSEKPAVIAVFCGHN